MRPPAIDEKVEAARYLAEAVTGVQPADLFTVEDWWQSPRDIDAVYERAINGHRTCGCERHLRLTAARDILLGMPPAARGELRLL